MIWGCCLLEGLPRAASSYTGARDRYTNSRKVDLLEGCFCLVVRCGQTTPSPYCVVQTINVVQRVIQTGVVITVACRVNQ